LHGSNAQYHGSLEQFHETDPTGLIDMLYHHLRCKYKVASEESSWSASLLFVLVHAIRMKYLDRQKKVLTYVVDTPRLDSSRIMAILWLFLPLLLHQQSFQLASELLHQYKVAYPPKKLFGAAEYLVHGRIENTNGVVESRAFGRYDPSRAMYGSVPTERERLAKRQLEIRLCLD
jgi:hypothetical protein